MKVSEIKKGSETLESGKVFMVIEGGDAEVMAVATKMEAFGFKAADFQDGDKSETEAWYIVSRNEVKPFKDFYKAAK